MAAITLERILALQAAYIRCIDSNALEAWPDFFARSSASTSSPPPRTTRNGFEAGIIYADTKGMLIDRVAALRQANVYEKQSYRHILGLPNIMKNGGDEAESETPFLVVRIMHDGQTDIFATGVYLDTVSRRRQRPEIRQAPRGVRFLAHRHADGAAAVMRRATLVTVTLEGWSPKGEPRRATCPGTCITSRLGASRLATLPLHGEGRHVVQAKSLPMTFHVAVADTEFAFPASRTNPCSTPRSAPASKSPSPAARACAAPARAASSRARCAPSPATRWARPSAPKARCCSATRGRAPTSSIAPRSISKADPFARKTTTARVFRLQRLADDVMLVHLRFPAGIRVKFKAGQHLNLILDNGERRDFSMANPPRESDGAQLHIRHVPGGAFTSHVFEKLKRGDRPERGNPVRRFHAARQRQADPVRRGLDRLCADQVDHRGHVRSRASDAT